MSRTVGAWLAICVALAALALPHLTEPGLYYDEAFMASQAKDFVEPQLRAQHPPGTRAVWIHGRPFPLFNAAYLGALKSQLQIPAFSLFGTSVVVLRINTLAWSALALLAAMLWSRRLFGERVAILAGVLMAADPTWLFFSLYEWGPFTIGFLCRALGLLLVTAGWEARRPWRLWLGALVFGLGVYSRVDFAVFLAAAGLALLVARPSVVGEALGPRRARALGAVGALALGALGTLTVLDVLFDTVGVMPDRGGFTQKAIVLRGMLEGSHFYRIIAAGGRFDALATVTDAPVGPLGAIALASLAALAAGALRSRRRTDPAQLFLVLVALLTLLGMLALPGAVRAHHLMNVFPFLHLAAAVALAALLRAGTAGSLRARLAQATAALLVGAALTGSAHVVTRTFALIERTGGRGWWSDATFELAETLPDSADTRVVSLDWGFHEPLLFLTSQARLEEPMWAIRRQQAAGRPWVFQGNQRTLYLAHEAEYDRFGLGPAFLEALAGLDPARVQLVRHRDRSGAVAFVSARIDAEHQLRWTGRFEIDLR